MKKHKKMRSSRLLNTKPQDDACSVRWDPHALIKPGLRMTAILNINGFSGQIDRNPEFCFLTDKIIWVDLNSFSFCERQMISTERSLRNHMITIIMNWSGWSYHGTWSRNSWKLSEIMWETIVLQCGHGKTISKLLQNSEYRLGNLKRYCAN